MDKPNLFFTEIGGLRVSTYTKKYFLHELSARLDAKLKTQVITPYSEFIYAVLHKPELLQHLNKATFSIADGIGVLWAATFLSKPFHTNSFYGKVLEGFFQIWTTLFQIVLQPSAIRKIIPEKIVGADIIWDIAAVAQDKDLSIYLLGGFGDTPRKVAQRLEAKFNRLRIVGVSTKSPDDVSVLDDIRSAVPDILLVAYGPVRQDIWIAEHLPQLPVRLAIGLGGTFDYVAGVKKTPPKIIRATGLEWMYRLFTQPHRMKRIRNATIGLVVSLFRYKVFMSMPYRDNVVVVVTNNAGQVLICKRKYEVRKESGQGPAKFKNYWQFPQGGLDHGEDLVAAAKREAFEETGLADLTLVSISPLSHQYDWRNGARPLLFNRLKFRGQTQRIVYMKYSGKNDDVRLDNREFEDYQWVQQNQLPTLLHPERLPLVDIVNRDL
jgi:N-acetylglucosaminyldiphosphoundecaprenol N-acetyl-beta-D-mannosaminyltransferase